MSWRRLFDKRPASCYAAPLFPKNADKKLPPSCTKTRIIPFIRPPRYSFSLLRGDLFGGHAGGIVALPLAPAFGHPVAALAGILIKVGVDILDYRMLKLLKRAPRPDLVVMVAVFAITVLVDLIVAVTIGIALAAPMLTWQMARLTQVNVFESAPAERQRNLGKQLQEESDYGIRVIAVRGAFFFGVTAQMQDKINRLLGAKVAIINCYHLPFMDTSAAFALVEMVEKLKAEGIRPILVVNEGVGLDRILKDLNCAEIFGEDGIQTDYRRAVELASREVKAGNPPAAAADRAVGSCFRPDNPPPEESRLTRNNSLPD